MSCRSWSWICVFYLGINFIQGNTIPSKTSILYDGEARSWANISTTDLRSTQPEKRFNMYSDWLKELPDSLSIGQITLPGTHDTMALYGGALSECQRLRLSEQLNYGVRALDIRCRHIENVCAMHHGPVFQNAFLGDVLDDSVKFLEANPSEILLMRLKEEHNPQDNTRTLTETIEWYLGLDEYKDYIWRGGDRIPTLGELRGKIIIIDQINGGYFGPGWFRCGSCGGPCSTECLQDQIGRYPHFYLQI